MKTIRSALTPLRLFILLAAPLYLVGCEHSSVGMDETSTYMQEEGPTLDNQTGKKNLSERESLSISPVNANVTAVGDTVAFVAAGGYPPYEWGVGNSVIGSIQVRNGNPCIYIVNQLKKNTVFVKDSRGAVAAAAIQVEP